jgi:hypothetical protein
MAYHIELEVLFLFFQKKKKGPIELRIRILNNFEIAESTIMTIQAVRSTCNMPRVQLIYIYIYIYILKKEDLNIYQNFEIHPSAVIGYGRFATHQPINLFSLNPNLIILCRVRVGFIGCVKNCQPQSSDVRPRRQIPASLAKI